jgi:hypothetical protein
MRRQSIVRLEHARRLLSDQHGIWCAWCLRYIESPTDLELHHLLAPRKEIQETFGIEPWVVPVHRHPERCHRKGLQDYANYAGRSILDLRDPKALEPHATAYFYDGYLPACLLLRMWLASESGGLMASAREQYRYTLIAAAGTSQGLAYLLSEKTASTFQWAEKDPETRVYLTAAQANAGMVEHASNICNELDSAKPRIRPTTSSINSKLSRVRATIFPDLRYAKQAVQISRDSSDPKYQTVTALLTLGSAYEASQRYHRALDLGLQMRADIGPERPSWWHEIQIQGLIGRTTLLASSKPMGRRHVRAALRNLLQAGLPLPDFRRGTLGGMVGRVTPTETIHWFLSQTRISKEELLELRREAILGEGCGSDIHLWPLGLQRQLIDSMVGKSKSILRVREVDT